jgi:hypothetical protein
MYRISRSFGGFRVTSMPWTSTCPDTGSRRPATARATALLSAAPAARSVGSTAATSSPASTSTDTATRRSSGDTAAIKLRRLSVVIRSHQP